MDPYLNDWLHLLFRWLHVVTGAAWIGTSFYFNWLNHNIRPNPEETDATVKGELWSVHGGDFWKVTKFDGAPAKLPETLHWFKFEAYFTWLSGMVLLLLVYWLQADAFMIDPRVAELSGGTAVALGIGTLAVGWLVYDGLCRSPLAKKPQLLAAVGLGLIAGLVYGLSTVLAPRAVYMHVGAMLGTCMAANVFFVIIPGQKAMVDAMMAGQEPDRSKGEGGSLRSLHNNYLTLPVLFVMVSNHFPITFGHPQGWAILLAVFAIGMGVRHAFNLEHLGQKNPLILPAAAIATIALSVVSKPEPLSVTAVPDGTTVSFADARGIIMTRCTPCHATVPTQPGFAAPPKDMVFESADDIHRHADAIYTQAIATAIMPLGNLTKMTDEERGKLAAWFDAGRPKN